MIELRWVYRWAIQKPVLQSRSKEIYHDEVMYSSWEDVPYSYEDSEGTDG